MRHFWACALAGVCALPPCASIAAPAAYKLVKTIDLPGGKGGHGDWTIYNPQTGMIWLSQSPDHAVVVIDPKTNAVAHVISGIPNGNGIGFAGANTFVADNDSNQVIVIRNYKKVASLTAGKGPDSVNFMTKEGRIYVSAGDNQATEYSDKAPFKTAASFTLDPNPSKDGPDIAVYVAGLDEIFQPDDNKIDVIDAKTGKSVALWDLPIKSDAKAASYDPKTGHIVIGTGDKEELVLDAKTGKIVATIPLPGAVDATIVDPGLRRAYVGDKSGVVDVIDLDSNKLVASIPSELNMHTLAVDTRNHEVFVYRNVSNKVDVFKPAG